MLDLQHKKDTINKGILSSKNEESYFNSSKLHQVAVILSTSQNCSFNLKVIIIYILYELMCYTFTPFNFI